MGELERKVSVCKDIGIRKDWVLATTSFTWNDYTSTLLEESGHVSQCCIHSLNSGTKWAGSHDFSLTLEEVNSINAGFLDDIRLRQDGLRLNNRRFTLTRVTDACVMVGRDERSGFGCVVYRCRRCLIAAVYEENNHPGSCFSIVTQLGDYLYDSGF